MTTTLDLGSARLSWRFLDVPHRAGEELALRASREPQSPAGWLPASVPGLSAQDLLVAGRIPDPYWGDQVGQARWIEERDFVYVTELTLSTEQAAQPARLVFDSLDTFASVYLNGEQIAHQENQLRRLFVDVTGRLTAGSNRLAIAFEASMPGTVRRAGPPLPYWNEPWERLYVRKSQMSYGWDWAARTPTVGIAAPARLDLSSGIFAGDLHALARPQSDGSGLFVASLSVTPSISGAAIAELLLDDEVVGSASIALSAGVEQTIRLEHALADAKRWMPRELGEPHLYRLGLRVRAGERVLHAVERRVGVRQIELVKRDPQSPNGKVFYFSVNGQKLWAKGDNWLPIDFLHTRVTPEQYRSYLQLLMAGGVNLLRVWGGGIVEHDAFYDACDELGLLVWQDFQFACGIYPDTPEFLAEVQREAEDIVKKLRSHSCIALWCGNNENEVLAVQTLPDKRFHPIYYDVLSSVCAALDPDRAYWPGSPAAESRELHPDTDQEGDRHNWDVWFGWKSTEYITDMSRFNSEFGAQAFPQRESIESFMRPDEAWSPGQVSRPQGQSPGLVLARHGAQMEKLFSRAAPFGPPVSLDAAIATTQAFQADTVGRYIRHYRRNMRFTGGVVLWNFTSTWPSVCWALVDFYRRPKQAYYECKRCFQPASVGIEPTDESQTRYVAHASLDRPGSLQGSLQLQLLEIATGAVKASVEAAVTLDQPGAVDAATLELPSGLARRSHALVATLTHANCVERDFRYLVPLAEVEGLGGKVTARRTAEGVVVSSSGWRLRVGVETFESPAIWSDNYFDLLPGECRTLRIAHGVTPQHVWVVAGMGQRALLPLGAEVEL
ncbi:MAG TPA: glycoside hydrolase family 2 protein [Polyangiaceae bacterium]|nr:glycoside hydrolase family 2 protein [Polyangiaceae bacterium]